MTILKTYARVWTDDLDAALPLLRQLTGAEPDIRERFEHIEIATLGDFLLIAGPAAERAKYTHASATVIVEDLDALETTLAAASAVITTPVAASATGRFLYARHADGAEIEYVEWNPDLVRRIVDG